ncbi:3-phenylpropionate/cinnamic acid dioxygenase subunit beta [Nocardia sp. SYP-A9097]|uniref:3-phenylpropionate/cinnamic acid dioxygenase subunit beta n=1 Tax=Nocardia sp. SYP-A9097 TaxID=2663237 RepID=UPI00129B4983|nr:3-phenylpropionate/cinnamic acid dioxygenase subunit beta [Nocardia sp. SYP-A9097]MRH91781.1 3-phenylpropionate/cinnamic acid dioxygenase subunit beta [Nocardia sp. SYP-A9097]
MTTYIPISSAQSPLGQDASTTESVGPSLAFDDPRHLIAHRWLVEEAYLLDRQDYTAWLDALTEDIHYFMPIKVTTAMGSGYDTARRMAHFDEDKYSLSRRVARFHTEHAWTEDPPSRIRHHLSNIRTFATPNEQELIVESAVLLFRSRGDVSEPALLSAGRSDLLRREGDTWRLARRHISADESVLRTQNLAIFL